MMFALQVCAPVLSLRPIRPQLFIAMASLVGAAILASGPALAAAVGPEALSEEEAAIDANADAVTAPVAFGRSTINRVGDAFEAVLWASEAFGAKSATVRFISETVQIDLPGAAFPKGKTMLTADDPTVRSVYIYEPEPGSVRVRFVLSKGLAARSFAGAVKIARLQGGLGIRLAGAGQKAKGHRHQQELERKIAIVDGFPLEAPAATASATATASASVGRDEIADFPVKLVAGATTPEAAVALARATDQSKLPDASAPAAPARPAKPAAAAPSSAEGADHGPKDSIGYKTAEAEIPVSVAGKQEKPAESDALRRALLGAVVLAMALGAVVYATKKYARRPLGGKQNAKIQVLGQHFLGPKKSLAIVHVAGESMLLGITDNSISLIKSLSLIDDEVPQHLPNTFDAAMEDGQDERGGEGASLAPEAGRSAPRAFDSDYDDEDNFAMSGLSDIRDVVSTDGASRARSGLFGRFSRGGGSPGSRKGR